MSGVLLATFISILEIGKQRHTVVKLAQAYITSRGTVIQTPDSETSEHPF